MISNCGKDERGCYSGGEAGDQTSKEYWLIGWYNHPWTCVLRHPDANVRAEIAKLARAAAENNKIGYDQYQRHTFWEQLSGCGFDPAAITVPCEADCSSSTASIVKAVGCRLNNNLKNISPLLTTYNMRAVLKANGFDVLTDAKYLKSDAYLIAGDILLNDQQHVAINVTNGAYGDTSYGGGTSTTKPAAPANSGTSSGGASKPSATTTLPTTTTLKQGDLVALREGATWWGGAPIPPWVFNSKWYILSINGMRAVLGMNEAKNNNIYSPIHAGYLTLVNGGSTAPAAASKPAAQQTQTPDNSNAADGTYVVKPGDTLWGIAETWFGRGQGWRYREIMKLNNLTSNMIHAGQTFKLPGKE